MHPENKNDKTNDFLSAGANGLLPLICLRPPGVLWV